MNKSLKVGLFLIPVLILQLAAIPTSANAEPTSGVATSPVNTLGVITRSGSSATLAATAAATNLCQIKADYVHFSESVPGSIKADSWILCNGTSFEITFWQVTIRKTGLIPHYLSGPIVTSGTAYSGIKKWYLNFPTACSDATSSIYWSTVIVYGYYAGDPNLASGSDTSLTQTLPCGTAW